METCEIGP